jgi:hypothetical protein
MSTEAGKELLWSGYHRHSAPLVLGDMIAAIEAEARAAVLRELREEVAEMAGEFRWTPNATLFIARFLTAIDRRLGDD